MTVSERVRQRLVFEGHVQGVGFRPTLVKYALRRRCTGWVRNEPSRNVVTAELQGRRRDIDSVLQLLDVHFNDAWHRGFAVTERTDIPLVEGETDVHVRRA